MDGQGGGIGAAIIKGLREKIGNDLEILALGTNSTATSRMMKAGANKGGTGENAIVRISQKVDVIIGPLSILMADSMMGEVTIGMASAVASAEAKKVLIPLTQEKVIVVGVTGEPLPHLVDQAVRIIREIEKNV
ncbi:MAG TPA: DUF3842 family protein [Acidobacteriota bacterium]|nr:DUF3842 family protein [Acidobacteriota bacterium]